MKTKTLSLLSAAALACSVGVAHQASAAKPFKIGIVASLTGGFASAAQDTIEGYKAWEKVRGLPGKKIKLVTLDDETNPVAASNAFRRLASDKSIKLIYLFIPSSSCLAVKSLASEFKVPIISGGAADAIGRPPNPWVFKVAPGVRDFMIVLVNYAKKKGYKRLATLNSTDAFGQAEINNLKELAPKAGLKIVDAESFNVEDTNFNAQLTRIRASKPDIIYNGASGRAAILTFKQIKQMGLKAPLVVTQAAISKAFFKAIGNKKNADGLLLPIQLGSFGPSIGGNIAKLYALLRKGLGHAPVYFNTFGFDVGLITGEAVKHSNGTRASIRNALANIKGLPAVNGPVTYTKADHTGQNYRSIIMGRLSNGKPVPAH
jgi:branched-chain amino acid transport system substrate-binding protein